MTLEDLLQSARHGGAAYAKRESALQALREVGWEFDPIGVDIVTFQVTPVFRATPEHPESFTLRALRKYDGSGWIWEVPWTASVCAGSWGDLLSVVCDQHVPTRVWGRGSTEQDGINLLARYNRA